MATKLGYTTSYLSAIEWGKRNVPVGMVLRLQEVYNLTKEETARLKAAYDDMRESVSINIKGAAKEQRAVALLLERFFGTLKKEELEELKAILEEKLSEEELEAKR